MVKELKDLPDVKREATSIKIRPDVWKEAKIEAIKQDMELSQFVEQAVWELIQKYQREKRATQ